MESTLAAHFLAGSILSWALPIALVLAVGLFWGLLMRRSTGTRAGKME